MAKPNQGGRRQTLARMIEDAPAHRPKRSRFHVSDEYADMGDVQSAAELRRHLRGGHAVWQETLR